MPIKPTGRKPGRPATGLDRRLTVLVEPALAESVEQAAARKGQTLSYWIRMALKEAMERESKGAASHGS
jgi:predicted HicB family RNase H-like nuclease